MIRQDESGPSLPVRQGAAAPATSSPLFDRLHDSRMRLGITLAIFLGINFILLACYLWSRGGQTVHVQVVVEGNQYTAYIDGKKQVSANFEGAPKQGGIELVLGPSDGIPSIPKPRGIDSIRVTDLSTGKVLFRDDFDHGPAADWQPAGQAFIEQGGVLGSHSEQALAIDERPWTNYVVDMTFKNPSAAALKVRATSDGSGVAYGFRPFRHYDNGFTQISRGEPGQYAAGAALELDRAGTVKSLLAMTLHPYPYIFVLLAVAFVIVAALQFLGGVRLSANMQGMLVDTPWFAAAGLAAFGLVVTAFINYSYSDHMPHVPDELAYLFQAKLMAGFHLTAPIPKVPEVFDYFYPPFIIVHHGHWMGVYPFGHPLLLAIGVKIGAVWLVPAALGAASVLLLFAIGRKVYSPRVGLLAAVIFVTSPFYLMTASNFMSHNTAAFYLLAALFCVVISDRRPFLYGVLGGLLYGLFFNTQQLSAVALIAPVGLLLVSNGLSPERRLPAARHIAGFLAGGFLMLGAYFLFNHATTGEWTVSGLQIGNNPAKFLGFGGENSASLGIQNQQAQLSFLLLVLNGWPLYVGLMFVVMPFVLATRHRWDWFLLVSAVVGMGVYVLYLGHGIMHGPRYWYVASPLLALLAARGADRAAEVLSAGAAELRLRTSGVEVRRHWAGILVMYVVVLALCGSGVYGWLLGRHITWTDEFVPNDAKALQGFNTIDDRLVQLVDDSNIHNALVLVQGTCTTWQCYGSLFWLNKPTLDGDIVYAKDVPQHRGELFAAYPDRYVYYAQFALPASLSPFGQTGPVVIENGKPNAPLAHEIHVPKPTPTTAPVVPNPAERDHQRIDALTTIAKALQDYYDIHKTYPLAEGLQSFCRYKELDAGCKVSEVLNAIPSDPDTTRTFYYLSDGKTFTLWVQTDNAAPKSNCPTSGTKPTIDAAHTYCVQGKPSS